MAHTGPHVSTYAIQLGARGRIVLPAEIREKLEVKLGDRLVLIMDESGDVRLTSLRKQIQKFRGILAHIAPERILSEELLAERREEARREEEETRRYQERQEKL